MNIEVEWRTKPQSGLTEIEFSDLGVKSKPEWDKLDKIEQEKRINNYLEESEFYIRALAVDWYDNNPE